MISLSEFVEFYGRSLESAISLNLISVKLTFFSDSSKLLGDFNLSILLKLGVEPLSMPFDF